MAFRLRAVWAWESPAAPLPSCRGAGDGTDVTLDNCWHCGCKAANHEPV